MEVEVPTVAVLEEESITGSGNISTGEFVAGGVTSNSGEVVLAAGS